MSHNVKLGCFKLLKTRQWVTEYMFNMWNGSWSSRVLFTRRDKSPNATPWLWQCLRRSSQAALMFVLSKTRAFIWSRTDLTSCNTLSTCRWSSSLSSGSGVLARDARGVSGTVLCRLNTTSSSSSLSSLANSSSSIANVSWKNLLYVCSLSSLASRCDFLLSLLAADLPINTWQSSPALKNT